MLNFNGVEIMSQFGKVLLQDLKDNTPGSVQDELKLEEVSDNGFKITGPYWIGVFEKGRGPTRSGAKRGSPTLQEQILNWIESKGIKGEAKDGKKAPDSTQLSWAISNYIHKHGNKLYRELNGGKTDYFDSVFTPDRLNAFSKVYGDKFLTAMSSQIIDQFKKK